MESHCIVDFAFDPVGGDIWVILEQAPSEAWTAALELLVVDGVSGARVGVEACRLSLPRDPWGEVEALGALLALVAGANEAWPDGDRHANAHDPDGSRRYGQPS